jgi:L-ribulose-5-phosphate 3-epimerase
MADPRIGVCSWSLRPRDPDHLVRMVNGLGLGSVQLALVPVVDDADVWGRAVDTMGTAGIRVASGMLSMAKEDYSTLESIRRTGGVRPDADWAVNRQRAAAVASAAAEAGLGLVTFHAGFLPQAPDDPLRGTMIDRLRAVVDGFAELGVATALETGQETAETLEGVLAELDRPAVGVNFDPANMILYGMGDPVSALQRLAPAVRQIHVKDAVPAETPGTWGTEVPAGQGAVDWPTFFDVARSLEPPVSFIIEREAGGDRVEDIARARDVIAKNLHG